VKITKIKTFLVDGVFRPWTFVKIETDQPGLVGWGDCTDWGAAGPIATTVERYAEWVVGRDPMQVEAIWWDLAASSVRHTGGIAWKAMAGIDSALWDIRGKVLGAPVWQLLGGKVRDRLRLYWSHCGSMRSRHAAELGTPEVRTLEDLRALAGEVKAQGYTAIKTNIMDLDDLPGGGLPNWRNHAVGDCPPQILRRAEALRMIRDSTSTPICTGESLFGTHQYKPFLELHAQDIVMPDLAWNGITMGKKLADYAHAYDVLFAPHNCHSPINTLVSASVCATVPNFYIQEFDVDDAPWRDEITTHPLEIENGHLLLSDRPGLGADLVEEELARHPAKDAYPYR